MKRIIVNENDRKEILSLHGKRFITEQQSNNITIKKLQELLLQKGFNIVGTADDKAGSNTLKAIQAALGASVNKQQTTPQTNQGVQTNQNQTQTNQGVQTNQNQTQVNVGQSNYGYNPTALSQTNQGVQTNQPQNNVGSNDMSNAET